MWNIHSRNSSRIKRGDPSEVLLGGSSKSKRLLSISSEDKSSLIPSLPDELSLQILARVPRICYLNLKSVSRAWKTTITSSDLFCVRKELGTVEEWLYILTKVNDDNKLFWYALDPCSGRWQRLPPMPNISFDDETNKALAELPFRNWNLLGSSIRIADATISWLRRKDALDQMPFCGCSTGAVDGCIYVLGGLSRASALKSVWRYDPVKNSWTEACPMSVGRAYCNTGILNDKLYVVGGITMGSGRGRLTPLQSVEVYDPHAGTWSESPNMPCANALALLPDSFAHPFKPIAMGMASYRGRLFVPHSLYCCPGFVDTGAGEVYDPDLNSWLEMPVGMGEGWPKMQAGTKLGVTVIDNLYVLDHGSAEIKVYDDEGDAWKVVARDVPIHHIADFEPTYLLASLHGKLHVITKDANDNITVLQYLAPSQSLQPSPDNSFTELTQSSAESERAIWRVSALRSGGSVELGSCQSLKV